MVAGADAGLQRRGDRGQPGRDDRRAVAALDLREQFFERKGRRRAGQAVAHDAELSFRVGPVLPLGDVLREDRRGVIDGRVDRAVLRLGIASEMRQQRVRAIVARPVVVSHVASILPRCAAAARWIGRHYCRRAAANASSGENSLKFPDGRENFAGYSGIGAQVVESGRTSAAVPRTGRELREAEQGSLYGEQGHAARFHGYRNPIERNAIANYI